MERAIPLGRRDLPRFARQTAIAHSSVGTDLISRQTLAPHSRLTTQFPAFGIMPKAWERGRISPRIGTFGAERIPEKYDKFTMFFDK